MWAIVETLWCVVAVPELDEERQVLGDYLAKGCRVVAQLRTVHVQLREMVIGCVEGPVARR